MARVPNPNLLLVEGKEELRVIPELMEKHGVRWEPQRGSYCVEIAETNGLENLLNRAVLGAYCKRSGLRRIGLLMDADADPGRRYEQDRAALVGVGAAPPALLPAALPERGLIVAHERLRLGLWIMPDNRSAGMLETFLTHLVGPAPHPVWDYAVESCAEAARRGAPFDLARQADKARIHCWLAWQKEPGRQLHQAILYRILNPVCAYAEPFVAWFCELFEVSR